MIIFLLVVGGGGFLGGMKYQEMQKPIGQRSFGAGAGGRGGQGQFRGNRPVAGDIIKSDTTSITVKLQDGSSKIVLVSDKTQINKASAATRADLNVGEKVAVFGQENPDGSVTAQNVQLNPTLGGIKEM